MIRSIATLAPLLLIAACAPQAYRADVGALIVQSHGHVGLQNSTGTLVIGQNMAELDGNLGLGDTDAAPYLRFEADWDRHRVKLNGFGYEQSGSGTLSGNFGDIPAGTAVTTSLDYVNIDVAWSYDLLADERWRLGPGVQAGYYSMKIGTNSLVPVAFETVHSEVIVPELYLDGEVKLGPVALRSNLGVMTADLGDGKGRYLDFDLGADLRLGQSFQVSAGYRHLVMDANGNASGRDFDADVYTNGFYITGGVRF
jgi:hypothetical protein